MPMIYLRDLLFESVSENSIITAFDDALRYGGSQIIEAIIDHYIETKGTDPEDYDDLDYREIAKELYSAAKPEFTKIIGDSATFEFVGGGSYGIAFDLGDKILKFEVPNSGIFSAENRTKMADQALWDKDEKLSGAVPMIYGSGKFRAFGLPIFWVIMEKLQTKISNKTDIHQWESLIANLILNIETYSGEHFDNPKEPLEHFVETTAEYIKNKNLMDYRKRTIHQMAESLHLANDWLETLIHDMAVLIERSKETAFTTDFHVGNVGIRRVGGEGYFKFFD